KPTILVAFGASHRATPATGPLTSLEAMRQLLFDDFEFKIIAKPTLMVEGAIDPGCDWRALRDAIKVTPHDLLMLMSFFDREMTLPILVMRKFGAIPARPTLLSPRGEFSQGALALKRRRKLAYISALSTVGLFDGVNFHATEPRERDEIASAL